MSEGNRLSYKIEFEADEESLIDAIGDAIISSKPAIDTMLQEVITTAFNDSVVEAVKNMGRIQLDVDTGSSFRREIRSERPVPPSDDTIGGLLKQTSEVIDRSDAYDIEPIISSAMGLLISQIVGHVRDDPAGAAQLLEMPASTVATHESRYGDLSAVIRTLTSLINNVERLDDIEGLSSREKSDLISIIGREQGMKVVSQEIMGKEDDVMSIGKMLDTMGITPDTDEDIGDILKTEVALALRKGEVTIAQYEPVVEEREQAQFDRVDKFLEKEVVPRLEGRIMGLISPYRERLGKEFGVDLGREVQTFLKSFGAIVSDKTEVADIGAGAVPKRGFDVRDAPGEPRPEGVNLSQVVEALNSVASALLNIGERESAIHVQRVSDLLSDMEDHAGGADHR